MKQYKYKHFIGKTDRTLEYEIKYAMNLILRLQESVESFGEDLPGSSDLFLGKVNALIARNRDVYNNKT